MNALFYGATLPSAAQQIWAEMVVEKWLERYRRLLLIKVENANLSQLDQSADRRLIAGYCQIISGNLLVLLSSVDLMTDDEMHATTDLIKLTEAMLNLWQGRRTSTAPIHGQAVSLILKGLDRMEQAVSDSNPGADARKILECLS